MENSNISNKCDGVDLDTLDAMARDNGYRDYAHKLEAMGIRPIDFDAKYEEAAEHCAKRGFWGPMFVGAFVGGLHPKTLEDIECNPQAFERRVREYMYGMSMEQAEARAAIAKATGMQA